MEVGKQFNIEIADLLVSVVTRFEKNRDFCRDYLSSCDNVADIIAQATEDQIDAEMRFYEGTRSREYCENVCIYRAIAEQLPDFDRFVMHGAAVSVGGRGYIFTAPSGTGKTTHVSLLRDSFGDKLAVINGDKPILGLSKSGVTVYSCPWAGKEGWKSNIKAPLGGIIILKRGKFNRIERIEPSEYFDSLIKQVFIPENGEMMLKTLTLVDRLAKSVDFYLLECDISREAAEASYGMMSENHRHGDA